MYDTLALANNLVQQMLDTLYGDSDAFDEVFLGLIEEPILPEEINTDFGFKIEFVWEELKKLRDLYPSEIEDYRELLEERRNYKLKLGGF